MKGGHYREGAPCKKMHADQGRDHGTWSIREVAERKTEVMDGSRGPPPKRWCSFECCSKGLRTYRHRRPSKSISIELAQ